MKKAAYIVLILIVAIFLINPLPSAAARGGPGGPPPRGPGGPPNGWWVPWAVIGGVAVLSTYLYSRYNEPRTVVIREQTPVYVQPTPSVTAASGERIYVYPRQGQSEELQARDRYECHNWAVSQAHYDPSQSPGGASEDQLTRMRADYRRAMGACFEGRGYTMR